MKLKTIDLYNYLLQCDPDNLIKEGHNRYRLKSHHSLVISNGKWFWFSHDFGGYNAYSYLRKVEGYSENDAWDLLRKVNPKYIQPIQKQKKNSLFFLPKRSEDQSLLDQYLIDQRKIHPLVIEKMVRLNMIYLDMNQERIIFVGYDQENIPRFACTRGIYNSSRKDLKNSQKEYSFHLSNHSNTLHLFEAPIDLLSYLSILTMKGKDITDDYLSLGGLSDKALRYYLSTHSITTLVFHLDNDEAGKQAYTRFDQLYHDRYKIIDKHPLHKKDMNEELVSICNRIDQLL